MVTMLMSCFSQKDHPKQGDSNDPLHIFQPVQTIMDTSRNYKIRIEFLIS